MILLPDVGVQTPGIGGRLERLGAVVAPPAPPAPDEPPAPRAFDDPPAPPALELELGAFASHSAVGVSSAVATQNEIVLLGACSEMLPQMSK